MSRNFERWLWVGLVVLGIVAGTVVGTGSERKRAVTEMAALQKRLTWERDGRRERSARAAGPGERRQQEQRLRQTASRALATPLRTERYQRVMQILDETTPENWKILWEEYISQTLEEGRVHDGEWSLFMNRVGEVAGAEAMEYFTHHGQSEYGFNRQEVLRGWAAVNPEGAFQWLQSRPGPATPEMWNVLLHGAATKDAPLVLSWLDQVPPEMAARAAGGMVDGIIQSEGMGRTVAMLEKLVSESPAGAPPLYLQALFGELEKRAGRMNWLGKAYPERYQGEPELDRLREFFR